MDKQVALITGAGGGIGEAVAHRLSERYAVAANDVNEDAVRDTVESINETDDTAVAVPEDLSDSDGVRSVVDSVIEEFGRIDALVNNAGVETVHRFVNLPEEDWDNVMDTNLKAQYLLSKSVANHMIENGTEGGIVNISSIHDDIPRQEKIHYDVSKAGVYMLTKDMALELAEHHINVNCVAPGVVDTPMNSEIMDSENQVERMQERIPWSRIGRPEDVADIIEFLLSDRAEYLTGVRIPVDGGLSLDP